MAEWHIWTAPGTCVNQGAFLFMRMLLICSVFVLQYLLTIRTYSRYNRVCEWLQMLKCHLRSHERTQIQQEKKYSRCRVSFVANIRRHSQSNIDRHNHAVPFAVTKKPLGMNVEISFWLSFFFACFIIIIIIIVVIRCLTWMPTCGKALPLSCLLRIKM